MKAKFFCPHLFVSPWRGNVEALKKIKKIKKKRINRESWP